MVGWCEALWTRRVPNSVDCVPGVNLKRHKNRRALSDFVLLKAKQEGKA